MVSIGNRIANTYKELEVVKQAHCARYDVIAHTRESGSVVNSNDYTLLTIGLRDAFVEIQAYGRRVEFFREAGAQRTLSSSSR